MGNTGQRRPPAWPPLLLALLSSACTEDAFFSANWPNDLIQVLLVTDEADVPLALPVQVFSPGAPIALEVPEGQRVKLHVWLLPLVFEGAPLLGCQLELKGEGERVPDRAVVDSYVAGPFTAGVDGPPSFGLLPPEARPDFELHYSACVPSQEICRRARVTPYSTSGFPDHDLRPVLAVDDDLAFFGLKPEAESLGVHLFRFERGGARAHLAGSWMLGLARYERDRLDWFRFFAWSLRPARSLERGRLVILGQHAPSGPEAGTVLPGWVVVRCAYGTVTVELAMSEGAYNGLAAWVESAPPGQGINVA